MSFMKLLTAAPQATPLPAADQVRPVREAGNVDDGSSPPRFGDGRRPDRGGVVTRGSGGFRAAAGLRIDEGPIPSGTRSHRPRCRTSHALGSGARRRYATAIESAARIGATAAISERVSSPWGSPTPPTSSGRRIRESGRRGGGPQPGTHPAAVAGRRDRHVRTGSSPTGSLRLQNLDPTARQGRRPWRVSTRSPTLNYPGMSCTLESMSVLNQDDLSRLSPPERLALISQLWDSLESEHLPLTAAQQSELDLRLETLHEDRREGVTWTALIAELEKR